MINKCPYCNSKRINKNGHKCNKQRYICRNCSKSFCEVDARVKRPLEQRKLCLILYSLGSSKNSIKKTIERQYNTKISYSLVGKWIKAGIKALKFDVDNKINSNIIKEENKEEKECNIIKDIKKEYYNITKDEEIYLDCNKYIIDKAETCLVESLNSSLRNK